MSFEIKLPLFEGPFDLLLFFIERDELDIHDIPISTITNDFLGYLHDLEQLNIEVASEFILVAATLMRIKAKMLLPRPVVNEVGEEVDPREELVRHLLEYKKYKSVVQDLANLEEERLQRHPRGNVVSELEMLSATANEEAELQDLTLYKLLKVLQRVTQRYELKQQERPHQVVQYPYTIETQREFILATLHRATEPVSFVSIMKEDRTKMAVIFNFLAILELLQVGDVALRLGEGYNNFWISLAEAARVVDGD
ncbi:MAG: segregation/condensation protein A [Tunicatimonas sp.]